MFCVHLSVKTYIVTCKIISLPLTQVIKNTSGCNLAVDVWSLGCTVLEMATSKPPWSQYEGVSNFGLEQLN